MTELIAAGVAITLVVATLSLFLWAAWSDLAVRLIPDGACLGVALVGAAHRAFAGWQPLALSCGVAFVLFICLVVLHARGMLGGGDVKLIAAAALGFSPLGALRFLGVTAMVGGALALLHVVLRRLLRHGARPGRRRASRRDGLWRRVLVAEMWRLGRGGPLPYGVAIAGGGAWVLLTGSGG